MEEIYGNWNTLHPTYFGFNIKNVLGAANNTTTTATSLRNTTSISYHVWTLPATNSSGNYKLPADQSKYKTIDADADLSMRCGGVADKMTEDVEGSLKTCWDTYDR